MRIKAKSKGDITEVKAVLKHPMLSYDQAKAKGKEPNFIVYINAKVDDKIVYEASTSQFLSKNPFIKFKFKGNHKGKEIVISWIDLKGNKKEGKAKIK